ncbi:unnamed protein product [Spirodela intermedia]|uniref:Uncharacterized protein n=1 Tax=Spirodela intermedia TaxID=51605 RepID=A0A7I8JML1_SPIIN|nr:unnamed protein product [Spirodela intermedia]CAA6671398.1 unnamed protein product [Spirodela intermedia]
MISAAVQRRTFHARPRGTLFPAEIRGLISSLRRFRKFRRRQAARKRAVPEERELELSVKVCIEEGMPHDSEVLNIAEMLRLNVAMAAKIAFNGLQGSTYKTRETFINDVGIYEKVELYILLCNDDFIRKLSKEWRDEGQATDVLSMSRHIPELDLPILMLGDIVVSVETAARQAEERGYTLLDEIRILVVHGLLHLLGFDDKISNEAKMEMEREEELVLGSLGWRRKVPIRSSTRAVIKDVKRLRFYRPKFRYLFCDLDGALLNSGNQISSRNAEALRETISRGVKVVIATGKSRQAAIRVLKMADLAGKDGIVSKTSPGVFLQGALVYGRQGREIYRRTLDPNVCREALLYSLEHEIPLVAFSQDRCLSLVDHPSVNSLHSVYHEPEAEVIPSVEHLLSVADIQKMVFLREDDEISAVLRPHWLEAAAGRASLVHARPEMLEIVPPGASKGCGVQTLLDHLNISAKEVMAIGDGENDAEMLQLASLGVALGNGAADAIRPSNDHDGVADAIYRYAF